MLYVYTFAICMYTYAVTYLQARAEIFYIQRSADNKQMNEMFGRGLVYQLSLTFIHNKEQQVFLQHTFILC